MTEDFRTMKLNDEIYDLAVKLCEFYASFDPVSFFNDTEKFEISEEDIERVVNDLNKTRNCIGIEEQLLELLTGGEADEAEEEKIKELIREVYSLRLSLYGKPYMIS